MGLGHLVGLEGWVRPRGPTHARDEAEREAPEEREPLATMSAHPQPPPRHWSVRQLAGAYPVTW